jgi:hypothetical protein
MHKTSDSIQTYHIYGHQVRLGLLNHPNHTKHQTSKLRGALTLLHYHPDEALLCAPLIHARQVAQEPIWLQHHLKKIAQMRCVRGRNHKHQRDHRVCD